MGLTSLQVCMDSSVDWLQGTIHDEGGMDSSSSPSGVDILTCSRPLIERRLRPPHDQALKCPRCESTHTKFCYYNNYSLSQPRYFCKTCRRYWTKGGTLRNIPVGGGCRKNKKASSSTSSSSSANKKPSSSSNDHHQFPHPPPPPPLYHHQNLGPSSSCNSSPTDLHLSFPAEMQFSHPQFSNFHLAPTGFLGIESPTPIDFMEGKYDAAGFVMGGTTTTTTPSRNQDFLGNNNGDFGMMGQTTFPTTTLCPQFGMPIDGNNVGPTTLMLPYDHHHHHHQDNHHHHHGDQFNAMQHQDVKPNPKILSLEWHDQGCSDAGKDSFGYLNGVGSWTGLMNGYGSSATNPLV